MKISHVIESKLRFLKLTRAGKIRLCVFSDKVLYHALNKLQRNYSDTPDKPFNVYFSLCLLENQRLGLEPSWDVISEFPNFDDNGDVTLDSERFDMKKCHEIMNDFGKRSAPRRNQYDQAYQPVNKQGGPTFEKGITYWKRGVELKYPDQCVDDKTNPTQMDPYYKPPLSQNDPRRLNFVPIEELKKAIKSGEMNKQGLAFLRDAFIKTKPELIPIIDAYLNEEATPNNDQPTLFEDKL